MTVDQIITCVFGGICIIGLILFCIFGLMSAEKTEEKKREFFRELSKYYSYRNKQFEEDNK